jgi:GntR family transcriptional regulator
MSELSRVYDRSRIPLYIQVASVMRRRIETKQWHPGGKIPTLVELEREFQVARVTVRQAVDILREEGLLRSQQGRGTFAAAKSADRHWFKLATTWDVLIESIKDNVLKRIKAGNAPPFPTLRDGEGELADSYTFVRSVQYKDDQPYGIVNLHLANMIYKRAPEVFRHHPALPVIAGWKNIDIQHAHQTVVIGSADPNTSDLLQIALGAPTAECRCVLIDRDNVAIYVADIIYRSDAIQLHIDLLAPMPASPIGVRGTPSAKPAGRKPARSGRRSRLQPASS